MRAFHSMSRGVGMVVILAALRYHFKWRGKPNMAVTLVRDDMHFYLGVISLLIGVCQQKGFVVAPILMAMGVAEAGFLVLGLPATTLSNRNIDVTTGRYCASLSVWCSMGAILSCLAQSVGFSAKSVSLNERAILATTVAVGVGAQSILSNFAAGLLLVLFRPFRVGDNVNVTSCGETITVHAITAFFTNGNTFSNVHVALPNSKVVADTITNYSSNESIALKLSVHVRFGQQRVCNVREAMLKAAEAFDARFLEMVKQHKIAIPQQMVDCLPKCAEVGVWGPMEISEKGVKWMLKPCVPCLMEASCIHLGYECIHDALMDAGIIVFEKESSSFHRLDVNGKGCFE